MKAPALKVKSPLLVGWYLAGMACQVHQGESYSMQHAACNSTLQFSSAHRQRESVVLPVQLDLGKHPWARLLVDWLLSAVLLLLAAILLLVAILLGAVLTPLLLLLLLCHRGAQCGCPPAQLLSLCAPSWLASCSGQLLGHWGCLSAQLMPPHLAVAARISTWQCESA